MSKKRVEEIKRIRAADKAAEAMAGDLEQTSFDPLDEEDFDVCLNYIAELERKRRNDQQTILDLEDQISELKKNR